MLILKILTFIIMVSLGTFTIIKGCLNFISKETKSSQTKSLILTSVILFIINITGSILLVYLDKI